MEGSSEFGWQRPGSPRGLNSSCSIRNPRSLGTRTVMFSEGNASHDSELVSMIKGRERAPWPEFGSERDDVGDDLGVEAVGPTARALECSDVSLRQWLDNPERGVDPLECVHIFSQVVDIVKLAHCEEIVVQNVRPSCFVMSSFNRVSFIESASSSDSGSDSQEYVSQSPVELDFKGGPSSPLAPESHSNLHSRDDQGIVDFCRSRDQTHSISQINSEISFFQSCLDQDAVEAPGNEQVDEKKHYFPMKHILLMELNWYTPPDEISGTISSASDIYQLGVLLFELFCTFNSREDKVSIMANLRHRVLPPHLLLKWPRAASFCLWLLHPESSSRPKIDEIMQSEFLNEPKSDIEEREAAIHLRDEMEEQELLLEFLMQLQKRKQEVADSLKESISIVYSDIKEVLQLQADLRMKLAPSLKPSIDLAAASEYVNLTDQYDSGCTSSGKRIRPEVDNSNDDFLANEGIIQTHEIESLDNNAGILSKSSRLMSNFRKLESAYYMTRCRAVKPTSKPDAPNHQTINDVASERSSISNQSSKHEYNNRKQSGWMNTFLEGLCKYLSFSKIKVKADLNQGDLLNSSNLVCSLSFNRDGEFFATAGVNKKIKVFEYNSILSVDRDIHYPVVEMTSKSKLSSICWNGYIRNQIASSNFEGVVQVWDITRSQTFSEMREHKKRVWSVDFSIADPMMLASGSDDGSVKLWNINQGVSVNTIQTKANICCVQFPADSGRLLAFGSADHKIYLYDLRNTRQPLCTLVGHNKAVSYVKFIDSTTLVSASTDNTLKLWDLSTATSGKLDCPLQSYTGHLNVKNFVGLSVSDGYIATGSETNEVFVYHKAFPMPALSFKFTDSLSSNEVDNSAVFISSVCWRGNSSTIVAANSVGNVKLLEMC